MKPFVLTHPASSAEAYQQYVGSEQSPWFKAGGTDLVDALKRRAVESGHLINLLRLPGMDRVEEDPRGGLRIGALTTLAALADHPVVKTKYAAVASAARDAASPEIRNVGTVGGNLCQLPRCWYFRQWAVRCYRKGGAVCEAVAGDHRYHAVLGQGVCHMAHSSSVAPALIALEASVVLWGKKGERQVSLEEFYRVPGKAGESETVLEAGEFVCAVKIPAGGWHSAYYAVREKQGPDWALVAAAVAVQADGGIIRDVRAVLGAASPIPMRVKPLEAAWKGRALKGEDSALTLKTLSLEARPLPQNSYKIRLAAVALHRAALSALS